MGNSIKYTTGTESKSLYDGNFRIGTGDADKGPTSTTGFVRATAPPEGGYRIYLYNTNVSNDVAYHVAANDSELISFTNQIAGQSYTTVSECLAYYNNVTQQKDRIILDNEYPTIPTENLSIHYDFSVASCRPFLFENQYTLQKNLGSNQDEYNIFSDDYNMTTSDYTTNNGGGMVLDGTSSYISISTVFPVAENNGRTVIMWFSDITPHPFRDAFVGFFSGSFIRYWASAGAIQYFPGNSPYPTWTVTPDYVSNPGSPFFLAVTDLGDGSNFHFITNSGGNLIGKEVPSYGASFAYLDSADVGYAYTQSLYLNGASNMISFYDKSFFEGYTSPIADNTIPAEIQQYFDSTKGRFGL